MEEAVPDASEQRLQHFLSESPWDSDAVCVQVAQEADALLGGQPDSSLLLDESGLTKKGSRSVGVARQYNGRLGKVDNCQVGVFAVLAHGASACPVGFRLYLPEEWTHDPARCRQAHVPAAHQTFHTKPELALALVREARQRHLRFAWVQGDGGYGHDLKLSQALDDDGERFVLDVHKTQQVYLEDPRPQVPPQGSGRGRRPVHLRAQTQARTVERWAKCQKKTAWKELEVRHTTRGLLRLEWLCRTVWVWDGKAAHARRWRLLVTRDVEQPDQWKYSLSNAPDSVSDEELVRQKAQRFWIERQFEDAKGQVGMNQYQVRGWRGWHHHMALVSVAMLFMLQERQQKTCTHPLLSCADVVEVLQYLLPKRKNSLPEVLRQLESRHARRQAAIESAYRQQEKRRRQRARPPSSQKR